MRILIPTLVAAALACSAWTLQAQQSRGFGPYEIHYNTLNTNLLSPEVASVYGIQRAGTQAMLNVTVLEKESGQAVPARVSATAVNLTGQRRDIELREIRDQDAIYYIGQFRIHDEENLSFSVEVNPEGHSGAPYELTFRQQFFTG